MKIVFLFRMSLQKSSYMRKRQKLLWVLICLQRLLNPVKLMLPAEPHPHRLLIFKILPFTVQPFFFPEFIKNLGCSAVLTFIGYRQTHKQTSKGYLQIDVRICSAYIITESIQGVFPCIKFCVVDLSYNRWRRLKLCQILICLQSLIMLDPVNQMLPAAPLTHRSKNVDNHPATSIDGDLTS